MKPTHKLKIMIGCLICSFVFVTWSQQQTIHKYPDTKTIIVIVKYKAQPNKENETMSALTSLIADVKKEPHFVNIKLHIDPQDKTNILLYEEWSDASYYNTKHMTTKHLQDFIESSKAFLAGPPEISFWKIEQEFK